MVKAGQPPLTLGSASPRRAHLLTSLQVPFRVETVEIDEATFVDFADPDPEGTVTRIAQAKFVAFPPGRSGQSDSALLLTADTLVACDGVIMGKPESTEQLGDMLAQMSGRVLKIATAVCVGLRGSAPALETVTTTVTLADLSTADITAYVASGVGMDKAGGLALQGEANRFIEMVDGCWSNVMGLPLCAVSALLDMAPAGLSRHDRCSVGRCGEHSG